MNKEQFFALYWEQWVLMDMVNDGTFELYPVNASNMYGIAESYLLLEDLLHISDEHAIEITEKLYNITDGGEKISPGKNIVHGFIKGQDLLTIEVTVWLVDYLRSKGYAVQAGGISVKEQIEKGWIKIAI